jgi:hypothetical protein
MLESWDAGLGTLMALCRFFPTALLSHDLCSLRVARGIFRLRLTPDASRVFSPL